MNKSKKIRIYYKCATCNKKYTKEEYRNHVSVCKFRQSSSDSNNIAQLYDIIEQLSNKYHDLETKFNKTTKRSSTTISLQPPSITFDEFVDNITVSMQYIDSATKIKNIQDIFMQLFNEYLHDYKNKDIPIKTINNKIFIYKDDKWTTICSSNIISIVNSFSSKLLRKMNEWVLYHKQHVPESGSNYNDNDYNIMIIKILDLNISPHSKIVKGFKQILISHN